MSKILSNTDFENSVSFESLINIVETNCEKHITDLNSYLCWLRFTCILLRELEKLFCMYKREILFCMYKRERLCYVWEICMIKVVNIRHPVSLLFYCYSQ